jgi:hypothetical protein
MSFDTWIEVQRFETILWTSEGIGLIPSCSPSQGVGCPIDSAPPAESKGNTVMSHHG